MRLKSVLCLTILTLTIGMTTPAFAESDGWDSGYEAIAGTFERVGTTARLEFAQRQGMTGMKSDSGAVRMNSAKTTKTRLTPIMAASCDRKRKTFFRKNFRWIRKHTHNRGVKFISKVSKNKNHFEVYEEMFKTYAGQPEANAYLADGQSLFQSYADPKLDIRQRVQWNVLISKLIKDKSVAHKADYQDHDTAYAMLVLAQARCEITADNSLAIQKYLKANGLSGETDKEARLTALRHAMQ